jgi:hypothetical protein
MKHSNSLKKLAMIAPLFMSEQLWNDSMEEIRSKNDISKPKPKKCLLKECNTPTNHKGGYCCAEHCKQDKTERTNNG